MSPQRMARSHLGQHTPAKRSKIPNRRLGSQQAPSNFACGGCHDASSDKIVSFEPDCKKKTQVWCSQCLFLGILFSWKHHGGVASTLTLYLVIYACKMQSSRNSFLLSSVHAILQRAGAASVLLPKANPVPRTLQVHGILGHSDSY